MYILLNEKNEIVAVTDTAIRDENGLLTETNGIACYFPVELKEIEVMEVPNDIKPFTYIYENGSFIINPNYVAPPKSQIELENEVSELKEKLKQTEADNLTTLEALAEVYEMLLTMQA